jgi:hypothetical protein
VNIWGYPLSALTIRINLKGSEPKVICSVRLLIVKPIGAAWPAAVGSVLAVGLVMIGSSVSSATIPSGLHQALQKSLDSHSFTMNIQTPSQQVTYEAPNRTSMTQSGGFTSATIGSCLYVKVSPSHWSKLSCNPSLVTFTGGRSFALGYLRVISNFTNFEKRGSTFTSTVRSHDVPSVMASVWGTMGSGSSAKSTGNSGVVIETPLLMQGVGAPLYTMKAVVVIQDGYLVSEQLSIADPQGHTGRQTLTYSRYGSSPAVNTPDVTR